MDPIVILTHGKVADLDELTQAFADKGMEATVLNTATATLTDILAALAGSEDDGEDKEKKDKEDKPEDEVTDPAADGEGKDKKEKKDKPPADDAAAPPADDAAGGGAAEETFEEGFQLAYENIKAVISEKYKTAELHANYLSVLSETVGNAQHTIQINPRTQMMIHESMGEIHVPVKRGDTYGHVRVKLVKSASNDAVLKLNKATFNTLQ